MNKLYINRGFVFLIVILLVGSFYLPNLTQAVGPSAIVYDAMPSSLAPNYPSQPFQAQQTNEFGDYVHLSGTNRILNTVTVTMSNWALASTPANVAFCEEDISNCDATGFFWPITVNIYSDNLTGGVPNTILATKTINTHIPWRPEASEGCGTAWRAVDNNCYNGYAFNATFDLGDLSATLTNDVIVGFAYNTQTYGLAPTGVDGPYNSLNIGLPSDNTATVGSDDNSNEVFWNTETAAWYADGGVSGVGTFRKDNNWTPYGTIPIQITATAPLVPTSITNNATLVTQNDAVINGTNGDLNATGHSFWVSLSPINTSSPSIPSGVYSTPDLGAITANTSFSATLSSITTNGVPSNLPPITPGTPYYFVAWSLVGGTWYPGTVLNFTTDTPPMPSSVKVTITKYINGAQATANNTNSASFPMSATWSATNIGSGTGSYALSTVGFNNPDAYKATTSDMSPGANYSTEETASTSCTEAYPFSFVGYSTGNNLEAASTAPITTTVPAFTNITSDKFIIVWNKTCPPAPVHVSPADNTTNTTAGQALIDWVDVTADPATPITYTYQASNSSDINPDGSFVSPVYTSETLTVSEIPTPGTPAGVYYWHVRATDSAGNSSPWSNAWKITIDNTPPPPDTTAPSVPVLLTPDNNSILGNNEFDFTWNASTDNQPGAVTYEYQASQDGTESSGVLTNGLWQSSTLNDSMIHSSGAGDGKWYWQVRAKDAADNFSVWSEIWNVILDTTAPIVTIDGGNTINIHTGDIYEAPSATVIDAIDPGPLTATPSGSVDTNTPGSYSVVYSATDSAGNTGTATLTVNVSDISAPVITVPEDITIEATESNGAVVEFTTPTAEDDVDDTVETICDHNSGETFPIGTTVISCTATDSSENEGNNSFEITVQDTTAPVITSHDDVMATAASESGAEVTYVAPDSVDAVDGTLPASCTAVSGSTFPIGTTEVTCTKTDLAGNVATATTFNVIVSNTPVETHDLSYSTDENGSLAGSASQTVNHGSDGTAVTAVPNSGFYFVNWSDESTENPRTDTNVQGNITVTANFESSSNSDEPQERNTSGSVANTNRQVLGAFTEQGKVLGVEKFIFTEFMKIGSRGGEVDELQKFLNDMGYTCGAVDGIFGPKTDACVRAFQTANPPLKVDGIVGPLTRVVLNK